MWTCILAKIRPETPKPSLAPEGLESKPEPLPSQKHKSRRERGDIGDGEIYFGSRIGCGVGYDS